MELKGTEVLNLLQCHGTGRISQTELLTRLLSLVELGVLGERDTRLKQGAAGFVALAALVEPPTSPLHAKHPTREGKTFHTHQAKHPTWV